MSVHDLLVIDERAALHFSEYGRSVLTGTVAAWTGISMYHWDGDRLTDCRVEQDYHARRTQLRSGRPNAVESTGARPVAVPVEDADPSVERATREWLQAGACPGCPPGALDDEPVATPARIVLDEPAWTCWTASPAPPGRRFHDRGRRHRSAPGPARPTGRCSGDPRWSTTPASRRSPTGR